jgi:transcriptional regulator with XRE-family HTH domain
MEVLEMAKRNTGRRQWDPARSGEVLKDLREREELSRREVAERLSVDLGRPVAVQHIREMEEGAEPTQEVFGHLLDLYKVAGVDDQRLYPATDAEVARQRAYAERRADLTKQAAELDDEWQPVRYRGSR